VLANAHVKPRRRRDDHGISSEALHRNGVHTIDFRL
jgi:hypothetical protein